VQKDLNIEKIKNHNNLVETRMIAHELEKFKNDMRKLSSKTSSASRNYFESLDENSEERQLLQALRESEDATFAYKNDSNNIVVEKVASPSCPTKLVEFIDEFSCGEEGTATSSTFSGSTATISEDSLDRDNNINTNFIKISTHLKTKTTDESDDDGEEFHDYYEMSEDHLKFNMDDDEINHKDMNIDDEYVVCCNDFGCQFARNENYSAYRSLPNLNDQVELESLIKITKFQSLMTVDPKTDMTSCYPSKITDVTTTKLDELNKSIEEAETEKMLIIRRMEIEEKNYQELIIMSNSHTKNINEISSTTMFDAIDTPESPQQHVQQEIDFLSVKDRGLLKKCFKDWLQKTTVAKILRTNSFTNEDRVRKINNFLNKVRIEHNKTLARKDGSKQSKAKVNSTSTATAVGPTKSGTLRKDYEHKMKIQQDIIELQKLKIQRQERMITEMKLAKFSEMLKDSKNDLKLELLNLKKGDPRLRAKARCIQINAEIKDDPEEDERRKLLAQGLIVPKFLQKMQQRALDRLSRHAEAKERRERLEIEKEEAKNAAELAKRHEDEETKRKRFNEMREKRRQEKLAKLLREQEKQKYLENMKIAKEHYEKNLLRRVGLRAFELLIRLKRTNYKKATIHSRKMCMKKCFRQWHLNSKIVWDHRRAQADKCYENSLLRNSLKIWKHIYTIHRRKLLVAIDWYEVQITDKLFKHWFEFTQTSIILMNNKLQKAQAHYNCQIKWKLFECWRRFPAIMKIERETEVRRQKWRMKVWDLLPDYSPQDTTS
jgi:hypothetical protein